MDNEKKIWDALKKFGLSDAGAAGLMGNLYAESAMIPTNLQNDFERKFGLSDEEYTKRVDNGTYTDFENDNAGYGLAQWTYWTRKRDLLAYAKKKGGSIGDIDIQLGYLIDELSKTGNLLNRLKCAKSVREASDDVLLQFERPLDQSEMVRQLRERYGQKYYDRFVKGISDICVGDIIEFTGRVHYTAADSVSGYVCRPGKAKLTVICRGKKHPYHIIHVDSESDVYGWVDADAVRLLAK